MMLTGNRGEWSELYTLLRLLETGRLYAADDKLAILDDVYFPILKILRKEHEKEEKHLVYEILEPEKKIALFVNGEKTVEIPQHELGKDARLLLYAIKAGGDRAFEINGAEDIMRRLQCYKIKASGAEKADITVQIHDSNTGYKPIVGFSIKSDLGSAPTLLNASDATNFVYECQNISDDEAIRINAIETKNKIVDRMAAVGDRLKYVGTKNRKFADNLMLIDSMMDDILGEMLLPFYRGEASTVVDLVKLLEEKDHLKVKKKGFYEYKIKKLLAAVALGMMPSKEWNGIDEASGGYIVVRKDGECVAYHLYNRNQFEQYLFDNTKLERASIKRHGYAQIYEKEKKKYINLNLQIRFK